LNLQAEEIGKTQIEFSFSNQFKFRKALFFSVISITPRENKVSVKYKTKNIKTDGSVVFLITINHIRANMISIRNFRLIATIICNVWLSASLVSPLKKIIRVITDIKENTGNKIKASRRQRLILAIVESKYAVINNSIFNSTNNKMYL
jgi:hypothetical protein